MTSNKTIEISTARDPATDEWQQVTPGERFKIRVSSAQTMGIYSVLEVVADPHNGVPLHIHDREEEHFIVLNGTLDIAIGNRRWEAAADDIHLAGRSCRRAPARSGRSWRAREADRRTRCELAGLVRRLHREGVGRHTTA